MAAQVPVPPLIAINLGDQSVNVLDFTVADDNKFYQKTIKGLDENEKYDLSPLKLKAFLDNVRQQA